MRVQESSTYNRLLAAAAKLFAQQGFDGTTTRQIVAEAGSSLSSLQIHFKSKESLYCAVMKETQEIFYALNAPILSEIDEAEKQGFLDESTAWDYIVQLTGQIIEWAFKDEYANEILLVNRELLYPSGLFESLPDYTQRLYQYYEKLFERYTGKEDTFWAKILSFSVITSLFDYANYPHVLGHVLGCDMKLPENKLRAKAYAKQYTLSSIRANLNLYKRQGNDRNKTEEE